MTLGLAICFRQDKSQMIIHTVCVRCFRQGRAIADIALQALNEKNYKMFFFLQRKLMLSDDKLVQAKAYTEEEAKIMAARKAIMDGTFQVYAGPLKDRDGNLRVKEGEVLSDGDLWQMDWFIDGVITQK